MNYKSSLREPRLLGNVFFRSIWTDPAPEWFCFDNVLKSGIQKWRSPWEQDEPKFQRFLFKNNNNKPPPLSSRLQHRWGNRWHDFWPSIDIWSWLQTRGMKAEGTWLGEILKRRHVLLFIFANPWIPKSERHNSRRPEDRQREISPPRNFWNFGLDSWAAIQRREPEAENPQQRRPTSVLQCRISGFLKVSERSVAPFPPDVPGFRSWVRQDSRVFCAGVIRWAWSETPKRTRFEADEEADRRNVKRSELIRYFCTVYRLVCRLDAIMYIQENGSSSLHGRKVHKWND